MRWPRQTSARLRGLKGQSERMSVGAGSNDGCRETGIVSRVMGVSVGVGAMVVLDWWKAWRGVDVIRSSCQWVRSV